MIGRGVQWERVRGERVESGREWGRKGSKWERGGVWGVKGRERLGKRVGSELERSETGESEEIGVRGERVGSVWDV